MLLINNHLGHFQAHVGGAFREDLRSSLSPSTDHNCQMQSTHQQTTETACKYLPCEKYSGLLVYVIMVMLFLLSIVLVMFMSILTPKRGKMDKICKVKLLNPFVQIDCTQCPTLVFNLIFCPCSTHDGILNRNRQSLLFNNDYDHYELIFRLRWLKRLHLWISHERPL